VRRWGLVALLTVLAIPATLFALSYAQLMIAGDCVAMHGNQLTECEHRQSIWMGAALVVCAALCALVLRLILRKRPR